MAIGIAGFSAVIAAFLQRGALDRLDRVRFVNLVVTAFATVVLAYVPLAVSRLIEDTAQIWAYSSAVMIAVWFLSVAFAVRYVTPVLRTDLANEGRYARPLLGIPSALNLGTQCLNVGGWFWEPGFVPYLLGLFVYLYAAGALFVYMIVFRPAPPDDASQAEVE